MNSVIGEILPFAVGIAISPVPVIAAILMLLSPRAKRTSVAFLLGWILGIMLVVTLFIVLASIITPTDPDQPQPVAGVIKLVLGGLLLIMAIRQWRGRPAKGDDPSLPMWMSVIDRMTVLKGLGTGLLLSAVNPKNLLMGAGAGVIIGTAGLALGPAVITLLVFTSIAGASVAIPVIGYLVASKVMAEPLESLRDWLVQNNATVMGVLLLVIGVVLVGKGIASF